MSKENSMFYEKPESKKIAKKVSIKSPKAFKESVEKLGKDGFTTHEKRALILAQNRSKAQLKRENLSDKEKKQFKEIASFDLDKMMKKEKNEWGGWC